MPLLYLFLSMIGPAPGHEFRRTPNPKQVPTIVGAFEGNQKAPFGTDWVPTTDEMMGGQSRVSLQVLEEGAAGTRGALQMVGRVGDGFAFPWAGTIWFPGGEPFAPKDLSERSGIRFWTKGDGNTYQIYIYSRKGGFIPSGQSFVAGPEWKACSFLFSAFKNIDLHEATGIAFAAGPKTGEFKFCIDEVSLK